MDACRDYEIDELLLLPDVAERIEYYHKQSQEFRSMIMEYTRTDDEIIITDLRGVSPIHTGNRFVLYSLFPEQNISIWIVDGLAGVTCTIAVGYSIVNRTSTVDVGKVLSEFGGGGHMQVGTCQVPYDEADEVVEYLINHIHSCK